MVLREENVRAGAVHDWMTGWMDGIQTVMGIKLVWLRGINSEHSEGWTERESVCREGGWMAILMLEEICCMASCILKEGVCVRREGR